MLGLGLAAMIVFEALRLYLGMTGNLSECLSQLSAFWFITLLIHLPLVIIYLITAISLDHILEICAQLLLLLFMAVELAVAFVTLRDVARQHHFLHKTSS